MDIIVRLLWVVIKCAVFDFSSRSTNSICGVSLTSTTTEVDVLDTFTPFISCTVFLVKHMLEKREQVYVYFQCVVQP